MTGHPTAAGSEVTRAVTELQRAFRTLSLGSKVDTVVVSDATLWALYREFSPELLVPPARPGERAVKVAGVTVTGMSDMVSRKVLVEAEMEAETYRLFLKELAGLPPQQVKVALCLFHDGMAPFDAIAAAELIDDD